MSIPTMTSAQRRVQCVQAHLLGGEGSGLMAEKDAASTSIFTEQTAATMPAQEIDRLLFHPAKTKCKATYDYVIVGAGSSGCALAARLAEKSPNKTVLLVDAGGNNQTFAVKSPFVTCPSL
jgi:NADH dehydrogenase FAD-containing subunit